jgi:HNH endonuclease
MFDPVTRLDDLRSWSLDALVAEFDRLDVLEAQVRAQRLLVLGVLDERKVGAGEDGALDTAGWVAAESKVLAGTARADVTAARALREQPEVADIALEGRLSRDQITPAAQLASKGGGREWAEKASRLSPQYLQREARKLRKLSPADDKTRQAPSRIWWNGDEHTGRLRVYGDFTADEGAKYVKALERRAERIGAREDGTWAPLEERAAEAAIALASRDLAEDADPDRATIVLHAPVPAWADPRIGDGVLSELGLDVSSETARRLACDANVQWIAEAFDGTPLGVGRRSRTVPRWLDRLVRFRDRHCRFPGCERLRGAQVHHIVHWADLGPTDYVNLVLLCPRHHTFLHEHKWSVRGNPSLPDDLVFIALDGREHPPRRSGPPDRCRGDTELALAA